MDVRRISCPKTYSLGCFFVLDFLELFVAAIRTPHAEEHRHRMKINFADPLSPYSIQKRPKTPNLSKICPDDCFSGFQSGTQICQKFVENLKICPEIVVFQIFDKFLTNLGPPDWNPEKQSSGQIWDKCGVRGVFECCKGKKEKGFAKLIQKESPICILCLHLQNKLF